MSLAASLCRSGAFGEGVCGGRGHFKVEGQTLLQFELAQEERDCLSEGQSQLRTDLPGAGFELWLDACGDYRGFAHGVCPWIV